MASDLINRLPDAFDPSRGDQIPDGIIGSKIVAIGTLPTDKRVEGGGLVLELIAAKDPKKRRIVFAFTELGMWVDSDSLKASKNGPCRV